MAKLSLTRRSFMKAATMVAAACGLGFAAKPSDALAEGVDENAGEIKRIRSRGSRSKIIRLSRLRATNPTLTAVDTAVRSLSRRCLLCIIPIVCATA